MVSNKSSVPLFSTHAPHVRAGVVAGQAGLHDYLLPDKVRQPKKR